MRKNILKSRIGCAFLILAILAVSAVGIYAILNLVNERGALVTQGTSVEAMLTKRVKGGAKVLSTADIGSGIGSCRVALYNPNKPKNEHDYGYALFEEQMDKRYRFEKAVSSGEMTEYADSVRADTFAYKKVVYLIVISSGGELARVEVVTGANTKVVTVDKTPQMIVLELPANSSYALFNSNGNALAAAEQANGGRT